MTTKRKKEYRRNHRIDLIILIALGVYVISDAATQTHEAEQSWRASLSQGTN